MKHVRQPKLTEEIVSTDIEVRYFFYFSQDLLCIIGADGTFKNLNPAWEKRLGWSTPDLLSRPWLELVHPEDVAVSLVATQQCEYDQHIHFENRYRHKDGSYRWFSWAMSCHAEGLTYAIAQDITAQKQAIAHSPQGQTNLELQLQAQITALQQANQQLQQELTDSRQSQQAFQTLAENSEESLRQAEAKYRSIFEKAGEGIFQTTLEGQYLTANPMLAKIYGYHSPEDLIDNLTSIQRQLYVDPSRRDQFMHLIQEQGVVRDFESQVYRRDGSVIWISECAHALYDAEGRLTGYEGTVADVTERKQAEESLQRLKDELEMRVKQRTLELRQVIKQLRQSEAQLLHQTQQLEQTLHELQQTQAQLIQTEKMSSLGQLVAGIAHEINNPANFIHGNLIYASQYIQSLLHLVQLYQQYCPQPASAIQDAIEQMDLAFVARDLPKLLASMQTGTERIRQIVLSLRNFSRLDEAEMKCVDIHEGIDSTLLILQHRLKPKSGRSGIQIIKDYGDLPLVECYAVQLNQVFMNILVNAIDVLTIDDLTADQNTPNPGRITIRTMTSAPNSVTICIRDNGPGVAEAVQTRLFDPFFTTKPVGQGTGLGLSICYQIVVKKHGGQIWCVSQPGQGTEFWVQIPVRRPKSL